MSRKKAYFENGEPLLEKLLSTLRFKKVIQHIPIGAKLLDLGCGYHGALLKLIKHRNDCVGVDISVDKRYNTSSFCLMEHNLNKKLPFPDGSFDVVVSLANLEHVESPSHMFKEMIRVLNQNGKILLTTPTTYSKPVLEFMSYKLNLISEGEIRDHKNYFNKKKIFNLCQKNKITRCQHKYFQFFMNNFIVASKRQ